VEKLTAVSIQNVSHVVECIVENVKVVYRQTDQNVICARTENVQEGYVRGSKFLFEMQYTYLFEDMYII
jgi:hypothetical protein